MNRTVPNSQGMRVRRERHDEKINTPFVVTFKAQVKIRETTPLDVARGAADFDKYNILRYRVFLLRFFPYERLALCRTRASIAYTIMKRNWCVCTMDAVRRSLGVLTEISIHFLRRRPVSGMSNTARNVISRVYEWLRSIAVAVFATENLLRIV